MCVNGHTVTVVVVVVVLVVEASACGPSVTVHNNIINC